jgi:hypothetical protein
MQRYKKNMKQQEKNPSAVDVQDIIEVVERNNIPTEMQIYLLEILNLALYEKQYPQDTTGKIQMKIQLLKDTLEMAEIIEENTEVANLKVRVVVFSEVLKISQISTANHDLTTISQLISFVTGNSYKSIYTDLQKGINFTKHHTKHINQANEILIKLNPSITIDIQKRY